MVSTIAPRAAQALLLLALGCFVAASSLAVTGDVVVVIGVTALLVAPWLSLLAPIEAKEARWPWMMALLGLAAMSFLM